ncbi:MAG TPA: SDR family oxidoreductase [Limnobacter sp.]|uniref:SDR family NAD(P)-dependent oxidoreductase n=1 Tax=Limnobacter sp. TaxID=2003368 RepID=UPI002EDA6FD5
MRNFVVTGAASGIGQALVIALLEQGHRVCACDINTAGLELLKRHADAHQLRLAALDVRDAQAWQTLLDSVVHEWGILDVLCNVAGVLKENWVHEATASEVDFHLDINVKGTVFGVQAAVKHMLPNHAGHIINIASLAGLSPVPGLSLYSASKFAVRGYSLSAALELAPHGIAVTTICPDAVQTPMLDIQLGKPQTELTFSGPRALRTDEVVAAILKALDTHCVEVSLPAWRGATAKLASLAPNWSAKALGLFKQAGRRRQQKIQAGWSSTKK